MTERKAEEILLHIAKMKKKKRKKHSYKHKKVRQAQKVVFNQMQSFINDHTK